MTSTILTLEKLNELKACEEGVKWFSNQKETFLDKVCYALIEDNRFSWANWLIVRCMTKKQRVQYKVFAAEQVIHIFEKKYPEDKRPREAIEATKAWVLNPNAAAAAYVATVDAVAATAAYAAAATEKGLQVKIISYGLELLKEAA